MLGKSRAEIAQKMPDEVDDLFKKGRRHPSTLSTRQITLVVSMGDESAFFQAWAAALCEPLQEDFSTEYAECLAINSMPSGEPLYASDGSIIARLVQMKTTADAFARLSNAVRDTSRAFQNENALEAYLNREQLFRRGEP